VLCLHRLDASTGSDNAEIALIRRLVPHLAEGLRRAAMAAPVTRVRTGSGEWLSIHASRLGGPTGRQTAVVVASARPMQMASLYLDAHGLTPAQSRVAALVLQGRSTRQIVDELHISPYTVQEHL
jgi:DNA-binding NarL/FixJ family response regulator